MAHPDSSMTSDQQRKLNVLFLSRQFPYPMDTGGKIRTGKLLEHLQAWFDVTLISDVTRHDDHSYLKQAHQLCTNFHPVPRAVVNKYSTSFYLNILRGILSQYPVTVRNEYSKDVERKIVELTREHQYDLLICDFVHAGLNFKNVYQLYPSIIFQHNVETTLVRRYFENAKNPIMKWFWRSQWKKMQRYEGAFCNLFDAVITVSEVDQETIRREFNANHVFAIPTGVDTTYFAPRQDEIEKHTLVFTGSMDWLPNEDGILFFAREILGNIKAHIPDVRLTVVGRNPSRRLLHELKDYPEIDVVGWVEDVRPYIGRHALYIIPLRIGGGTRIKAYEAMAMGKAIVSTRVGMEGLPVENGEHVLLADQADAFAQAVVRLLQDDDERERMAASGRDFVQIHFSWERAAEAFAAHCRRILREAPCQT